MLQAKIMNKFQTDNSLLPIQIVAILPCQQSLPMSPPPTQTFLLTPKRIDDPKMAREPVLQSQHPKVEYHGTSDPSTNDVTPVPQQAEVAGNECICYCTARLLQGSSFVVDSRNQLTRPEHPTMFLVKLKIRILSVFYLFFLFERILNSPLRFVFEITYHQYNLDLAARNTIF